MQQELIPINNQHDVDLTDEETQALIEAERNDILTRMVKIQAADTLRARQLFVTEMNKPCPQAFVRKNYAKMDGLPISFVEMMLDAYYIGEWSTTNFRYQVVVNEVVGSINLNVTNPITGRTRTLTGAASVQIMVNQGSDFNDVTQKKPNALEMGFPKLKAMCVKNAAKQLGKRFGRDLNRKATAEPLEIVKTQEEILDAILQEQETTTEQ